MERCDGSLPVFRGDGSLRTVSVTRIPYSIRTVALFVLDLTLNQRAVVHSEKKFKKNVQLSTGN